MGTVKDMYTCDINAAKQFILTGEDANFSIFTQKDNFKLEDMVNIKSPHTGKVQKI